MYSVSAVALVSLVVSPTHTACVDCGGASVRKVPPSATFHTLHWLVFEPAWPNSYAAYVQTVPNAGIGYVNILECEDRMGRHLSKGSTVCWLDPSGFVYGSCWEVVRLLDFS